MLAGRDAAVAQDVRERDERRDRPIVGRLEPGDRAAVGRIKLLRVAEPDVIERRSMPGQAVIGGRIVVLHPVIDRADLGELVDHRGESGQMLADRIDPAGRWRSAEIRRECPPERPASCQTYPDATARQTGAGR